MFARRLFLIAILGAATVAATTRASNQVLLVTDSAQDTVRRYDLNGNYLGTVFDSGAGGVNQPLGLTIAPDGSLLVSGDLSRKVHRYDLTTGASLGVFAETPQMVGPAGMTFHNGALWVSDGRTGRVFRFDEDTGADLGPFLSGMAVPEAVIFDDNGKVIVGDWLRSEFRIYDEATGAFEGFVTRGNGLNRPLHAELSEDGSSLLAVNFFGNTLTEHDVETGDLLRSVDLRANGSPMSGPVDWIALNDGTYIVSSTNNGLLLRYDADWIYTGIFAQGNATRAGAMVLVPSPGLGMVAAFGGVWATRRRTRPVSTRS
ncbi:MAG: hypothetical protein AAGK04_05345 [Planctomycetota bacterium]